MFGTWGSWENHLYPKSIGQPCSSSSAPVAHISALLGRLNCVCGFLSGHLLALVYSEPSGLLFMESNSATHALAIGFCGTKLRDSTSILYFNKISTMCAILSHSATSLDRSLPLLDYSFGSFTPDPGEIFPRQLLFRNWEASPSSHSYLYPLEWVCVSQFVSLDGWNLAFPIDSMKPTPYLLTSLSEILKLPQLLIKLQILISVGYWTPVLPQTQY